MYTVERIKAGHLVKWVVSFNRRCVRQYDQQIDAVVYADRMTHAAKRMAGIL
jgi:hypothetical protein